MKKTLLILSAVAMLVCMLAISAYATTYYKDENGTELFECEIADTYHIASYEIKNGGFAKVDGDGDALTWYLASTETVGSDIVKTVKAVKTRDVYANGSYTGIEKNLVVSANFEHDTAVVPVYGAYSGSYNKELLFIYIPDAVTTLPYRFLQNVPVIKCEFSESSMCESWNNLVFWGAKSLRELFIPKYFKSFPKGGEGQMTFDGCSRLEKLTFHKESTLEEWPSWYFDETAIKEIRVPDSITAMNSRAFQGMTQLETVYLSPYLTHIYKTENNHSFFWDCHSLETVYIPKGLTADNLVDNYGGGFDYFCSNNNTTFVYTGTLEEFLKIQAKICQASNNWATNNATVENGRIVIADHCEVFYGGHKMADEKEMHFTSYFEPIKFAGVCTNGGCGYSGIDESLTIGAIFDDCGYSVTEKPINGKLSMIQCYKRNQEAYDKYVALRDSFEFGVVVSIVADPLNPENSDLVESKQTYIAKQSFIAHDYFDVGVSGISENQTGVSLVFCAYVIDNGEYYYLDGGETVRVATAKSHADLAPKAE